MLAVISAIIGGIQSLASIVQAVRDIFSFVQANKNEVWFQDSAKFFSDLRGAKTDDERKALAKRLRDIISGLG